MGWRGRWGRCRGHGRRAAEPLPPRRPLATALGALLVAGLAFGALTVAAGGRTVPVRSPLVPYGDGAGSPGVTAGAPATGPGGVVAVAVLPLVGAVRSTPGAAPTPTGCTGAAAVPDVSRLRYPASSRALLAAGFPGVDVAEHSGGVPLGGTLSQSPAAGTVRPCGTEVTLVYSSGPVPASGPAAVPAPGTRALSPPLCTLPPADGSASALLGRLRALVADDHRTGCALSVARFGARSATVPAGDVISEQPLPGTRVGLRAAVLLTVSLGAPSCALPTLTGDRQAAAIAALLRLRADDGGRCGLAVAVTAAPSATAAPGTVLAQAPAAGTPVAPGSAVTLTVSSGSPASAGPSPSPSPSVPSLPSPPPSSSSLSATPPATPPAGPDAGPAGSGPPGG
ncbi:PASTA domain-containing protein [Streptacidiphilus sp. P02-A3a]|uniref:PASTA domain-containing protein n=1 Tax=Streptacidiphilus sp. P02-A3a TaxID=2704468 RepID=UPI0015F7FF97|nr:PASTA domain-containing protein [Streptacidiphilus sp. P02-A3a]QMU68628.1 PASTA domain-containing protein [Streptacidiphilus sp. P02-A3a]